MATSKPSKCGTHIHIGGLNREEKRLLEDAWVNGPSGLFVKYLAHIQRIGSFAIKPVTHTRDFHKPPLLNRMIKNFLWHIGMPNSNWFADLKHLTLARRDDIGTMEFRVFESSLDSDRVSKWLWLCGKAAYLGTELAKLAFGDITPQTTSQLLGASDQEVADMQQTFGF